MSHPTQTPKTLTALLAAIDVDGPAEGAYFVAPIPSPQDQAIRAALPALREQSTGQRAALASAWANTHKAGMLGDFALRATIHGARTRDAGWLRDGLFAGLFVLPEPEYQDAWQYWMHLAIVRRAAGLLGLDGDGLIRTARDDAPTAGGVKAIDTFLGWAPNERTPEARGARELRTRRGIVWVVKGQPVPAGW